MNAYEQYQVKARWQGFRSLWSVIELEKNFVFAGACRLFVLLIAA